MTLHNESDACSENHCGPPKTGNRLFRAEIAHVSSEETDFGSVTEICDLYQFSRASPLAPLCLSRDRLDGPVQGLVGSGQRSPIMGLAPNDEENAGHQCQNRQNETLVLKGETKEVDERV